MEDAGASLVILPPEEHPARGAARELGLQCIEAHDSGDGAVRLTREGATLEGRWSAGRPHPRRHSALSPHQRNYQPPQGRPPQPCEPRVIPQKHRRHLRPLGRGQGPDDYAPLPCSWSHRRPFLHLRQRRNEHRPKPFQCQQLLARGPGADRHLVLRRPDHAPDTPFTRRQRQRSPGHVPLHPLLQRRTGSRGTGRDGGSLRLPRPRGLRHDRGLPPDVLQPPASGSAFCRDSGPGHRRPDRHYGRGWGHARRRGSRRSRDHGSPTS